MLKKHKKEITTEFQPSRMREVWSSLFGFQKEVTLVSSVTKKKNKYVVLPSTAHDDGKIDQGMHKPHIIWITTNIKEELI